MKRCTKCLIEKPLSEFYLRPERPCNSRADCKECERNRRRLYALGNKDKIKNYDAKKYSNDNGEYSYFSRILRKFGLTKDQYLDMVSSQNGLCLICKSPPHGLRNKHKRRLHVDHCHNTGKIRGLLCDSCNVGISRFDDNPDLLLKAASYFRKAQ